MKCNKCTCGLSIYSIADICDDCDENEEIMQEFEEFLSEREGQNNTD